MSYIIVFLICLSTSLVYCETSVYKKHTQEMSPLTSVFMTGLNSILKPNQCSMDFGSCLKLKLIGALDAVSVKHKEIPIYDSVYLVQEQSNSVEDPIAIQKIQENLPRSLGDKSEMLNTIILDKLGKLVESFSIKFKLSSTDISGRSFKEEGRLRRRKNGLIFMAIPLILAGTLVPIAVGSLALFAGKALLVSKLALVLASIIGIKKLIGGKNEKSTHEVYVSGHHGHGHDGLGRAYETVEIQQPTYGQEMAYSAYKQP